MSADRAFMWLIERHEVEVLINALMLYRDECMDEWGGDQRIDVLLKSVMTHAGLPWCKKVVPEAYNLVFPERPPRKSPYGKYNK